MSVTECPICKKLRMIVEGPRARHLITCPAYHDKSGKRALVHQGHCTGAFEGTEPCKYYIGNLPQSSSVCWCGLEKEFARRREAKAKAEREQATGAIRQT